MKTGGKKLVNNKRALLVGINSYPGAPLSGCINDIKLFYKILKEIYKFNEIRVLTNEEATKLKIVEALKWLVRGSRPGDQLYFGFSGHGSQVVVDDFSLSNESDGLDEIICPIDLNWDDPLRDHYIGEMFKCIAPGTKLTVILDCCHSGTGLRNPSWKINNHPAKNRYLPAPVSNIFRDKDMTVDWDTLDYLSNGNTRGIKHSRPFIISTVEQGDAILIAGCQDNQTAADAFISGRYHGALSFYLAKSLRENDWNIKYSQLIEAVTNKLDEAGFEQNPQLEGKSEFFDNLFLGGR